MVDRVTGVDRCQTVTVPELVEPTVRARESFLDAARALRAEGWLADFPVEDVEDNFPAYVRRVTAPEEFWGVPVSTRWYLDRNTYLGTVVFRHVLTPELIADGGHIGYHIAPGYRGRGYANDMLAQAIKHARSDLGIESILLTCAEDNIPSRRVIEANGGVLENILSNQRRYWIQPQATAR